MPLILLLVLLVLFSPLAIDIYLPAIPQMAEQLGAEVTLMQGTITWFLFSMGLGQLLVGPLADRYGRKPIALGGVLLYGLSALGAGFAASLGELMLARVLQGLGACATSVAAFSVVRDSYGPKKSGQMISYLNGAICFIPALAPLLGGWLTAKAGWSANFWFMAGYAVIVGSWLLWRMPETRPEETRSGGPLISWSRYSPVLRLSLDQILIPCAIRSLAARKPSSLLCRASQPSQRAPQLAIPVRLLSIKPPSLAIAM
jgi:DHA1 family bicyclomycin/chloramphenicol resistance-like MFS transporter